MREQFTTFATTATTTLADGIETANVRALDAVVDANRRFVEFAVTTTDRIAEQIKFDLPFADRLPTLPTPAENGERYLDFVERAVAVNREFNERIVTMLKVDAPAAAERFAANASNVADAATDKVTETVNDAVAAVKAPAKTAATRTAPVRKAATKRAAATKTTAARKTTAAKKTAPARKTASKAASKAPAAT